MSIKYISTTSFAFRYALRYYTLYVYSLCWIVSHRRLDTSCSQYSKKKKNPL
ncbi:hypothetical protein Lalb_Chr18g0053661 [Lupinus albus]|uniref:Uncharacterized protein n=1 Tax=Lupinus albus TaxID=3870 RepID=A0A6A4NUM7_LUPAL|nr:hypothetical protein Lalb_Chr18g0053661 [Lupinus albus]